MKPRRMGRRLLTSSAVLEPGEPGLPADRAPQNIPKRSVVATALGNAMEWYDFGIYAYLATYMAQLFFSGNPRATGLILTFSALAVGYLGRPLGSLVLGRLGDRYGRRNILTLTMFLMALSTFLIGALPTYAAIGVAAPIALTALRVVQGFAAGGEWGGGVTYLVEHAPARQRAFTTSWQTFTVQIGTVLGAGAGVLVISALPEESVLSYGWRIPFLIGILLGGLGIYMRSRTAETPVFQRIEAEHSVERAPLSTLLRYRREIATIVGICVFWQAAFGVYLVYMPTYLAEVLHFPESFGLLATAIATLFSGFLIPVAAVISDRIGRRPVLLAGAIFAIVTSLPFLWLIAGASKPVSVLLLCALFLPLSACAGAAPALLAELMPTKVRYSGVSIPFSFCIVIFTGSTPLFATFLIQQTGAPLSLAIYMIVAAIVGLAVVLRTPETSTMDLRGE